MRTGRARGSRNASAAFPTRKEAQEWERTFQQQNSGDLDMTFEAFTEVYEKDIRPRLKENTWLSKEHIIRTKLLPYFGKRIISEIGTKDVIAWQNELLAHRDEKKQPYSPTYLKSIHNQGSRKCTLLYCLQQYLRAPSGGRSSDDPQCGKSRQS